MSTKGKVFYHGTSAAAWDAIKREGLKPHASAGADQWAMKHNPMLGLGLEVATLGKRWRVLSVYITKRPEVAAWFARMAGDVHGDAGALLRITIPATDTTEIHDDEQASADEVGNPMKAYRYCGAIPPAWIKEVTGATRAAMYDKGGPLPDAGI